VKRNGSIKSVQTSFARCARIQKSRSLIFLESMRPVRVPSIMDCVEDEWVAIDWVVVVVVVKARHQLGKVSQSFRCRVRTIWIKKSFL
jgi:hypothetical protein